MIIALVAVGAAFALLPGITELVSFGSLTFLAVFAVCAFVVAGVGSRSSGAGRTSVGDPASEGAGAEQRGDGGDHDEGR